MVWVLLIVLLNFLFPASISAHLYLNEILPNPSTSEPATEWLELYNASTSAITLTGYVIGDADNHLFILPEATISAHGYLVFYGADGLPSLNNTGDTISLYDSHHQLLDSYTYSSSSEDLSWARVPDGGDFASQPQTPSPNQPNPSPSPPPSPSPSSSPASTSTPTPSPPISPSPIPTPTPSTSPASSSLPSPTSSSFSQPHLKLDLPTILSASTASAITLASSFPSSSPTSTSLSLSPRSALLFIITGFFSLFGALIYFFFLL